MHFSTLFLTSGLVHLGMAAYSLTDDMSGDNFVNMFNFETENDPTNGYVNYLDKTSAQNAKLLDVTNGVVTLRVDSTNVASGRGRDSIRVSTAKTYQHALVVLDLAHMPGNACGIWPAFWMLGPPTWPANGEIDIIEGVNHQSGNTMTMHTSDGCSMAGSSCLANKGCGIPAGGANSYGDGFNNNGGGVYAMEWTSGSINIWFFPKGTAPADASGSSPDPAGWGTPTANFQGGQGCTIDDHFSNQQLIFDTTFCGDWAGQPSVWAADSQCSSQGTCQSFVQNNPSAFAEAYWTINSLKVFTTSGAAASVAVSAGSSSVSASVSASISLSATDSSTSVPMVTSTVTGAPTTTTMAGNPVMENSTGGIYVENAPSAAPAHRAARHLKEHVRKHAAAAF